MELGRWVWKTSTGRERERQTEVGQVDRWKGGEREELREKWMDGWMRCGCSQMRHGQDRHKKAYGPAIQDTPD